MKLSSHVVCASHLSETGRAILSYSNDHHGKYPPDLGTLVRMGYIAEEKFICPWSGNSVPGNLTRDQAADWANANSDYIYVGGGLKFGGDPSVVVMYDKENNHDGVGMNFLFADGHVEFFSMDKARELIRLGANPTPNGTETVTTRSGL